jgi:hypothetical protein
MQNTFYIETSYIYIGLFVTLLALLVLNFGLFLKFRKINKLTQNFFSGKNGKDLEEIIVFQGNEIKKINSDISELFDGYEKIYKIAARGIQKVGVVRYNPFRDMGGSHSFSIAMLDSNNSGLIISTLTTRDGARIFSKAIVAGECAEFPLLEEEKKAIKIAQKSKKNATV